MSAMFEKKKNKKKKVQNIMSAYLGKNPPESACKEETVSASKVKHSLRQHQASVMMAAVA